VEDKVSYAHDRWLLTVFGRVERGDPYDRFDAFYRTHIPRLLTLDYYTWGRRYYSRPADGRTPMAHLAVYEFLGEQNIAGNLGVPSDATPELVKGELAAWATLNGVSDVAVSIFDQIAGPHFPGPMMSVDDPMIVSYIAPAEGRRPEVEKYFSQSPEPNSIGSDHEGLMRFRRHEHPALAHP
jgi:hypothetical protein